MSKAIVAAFLVFAGGMMLIFSISGPWYSTRLDADDAGAKYTLRTEYRFFEVKTTNQSGSNPAKAEQGSYDSVARSTTGLLMLAVFAMLAIALTLGAIGGALALKGAFGAGGNADTVSKLALGSAVLAIILPIVFAIAFPLTIGADSAGCPEMGPCDGLMGSGTKGTAKASWGPTAQYFVSIVAAILMMIGRRLMPDEFVDVRKQPLRAARPGAQGQQWQGRPQQPPGQAQWPADMWGPPPEQQQQQTNPQWQGRQQW